MGLLWFPGVWPLLSGLVAEMFGIRYMATLLGISFVVHQVGASLGAWGGGIILAGLWRFWVSDSAAFACMKLAPISV